MALLSYRSTPLPWCGLSPAQLLMGRQIRSNIPQTAKALIPQWPYIRDFRLLNETVKQKQKANFDICHGVRTLPDIPNDTAVWVSSDNNRQVSGHVTSPADAPRSYLVETPSGQLRQNRSHLIVQPEYCDTDSSHSPKRSQIMTRSRSGITIKPPVNTFPRKGDVT